MLIKTTPELKQYFSGIDTDYNFASLLSFVNDAEADILVPAIGQEIYDAINAAYNAGPLVGKQLALNTFLQKAVTHLALMLSADSGSFRIAESGFYVVSTSTNKPVSDKKMSDFKIGRREGGYKALEQAIQYLEKNINDTAFAVYAASDAHLDNSAYFINDSITFTRYYSKLNKSAYAFTQIIDSLDYAERNYIMPVLTPAYFTTLKAAIAGGTATDDQKKLLPYINRALVNFTIAKAIPNLNANFINGNLLVFSQPTKGNFDIAEDKTPATAAQLSLLVSDAHITAQSELRNLADYLVDNALALEGYTPPVVTTDVNVNDPCSKTFFV